MNKQKPLIIFDADKVLLEWLGGFLSFLKDNGYCTKHVTKYVGTTEFLHTEFITKNDCKVFNKNIINQFLESGYLRNLETFQNDAVAILTELKEHYDFAVVTCIGRDEESISQRNDNLNLRYKGLFTEVVCIDFNESKEESLRYLAQQREVVAFIDDREKHLEEAIAAGIKPILMSRGLDGKPTISDKYDVISCLSEIKPKIAA